MGTLGIFLGGALVGAGCMWLSCRRASIAADGERRRNETRIQALQMSEQSARNAADHLCETLNQMRIDQANNAGYVDGYHACQKEMEAQNGMDTMNGFFANSLRDGKRVVLGVYDR